jgi:translin
VSDYGEALSTLSKWAQESFYANHQAREKSLLLSRECIRLSANTIRAVHRQQFDHAMELLEEAGNRVQELRQSLMDHQDLYYAGFVQDAQKEYSEANATLAFVAERPLPLPKDINVEIAPYLNGLGEAVGELRRFILDALRRDEVSRCEAVLGTMDDIYNILVVMDFPEGVTGGLRRTTDMVRGVLERTRGDLTTAVRQRSLERDMENLKETLLNGKQNMID